MQATVNVSKEILEWVMACVRLDILPTQIANYLSSTISRYSCQICVVSIFCPFSFAPQ